VRPHGRIKTGEVSERVPQARTLWPRSPFLDGGGGVDKCKTTATLRASARSTASKSAAYATDASESVVAKRFETYCAVGGGGGKEP
jgi:hypothetical protein